jgi:chromodomain-helicase-DNA-binding protein 7
MLKKYQVTALNWLIKSWHEDRNVVLADEMGLGKTIMTLSFFNHLYTHLGLKGPFLVIAPLTTLEHWNKVAQTWTSMNTVLYYDQQGQMGRQELRANEFFYQDVDANGMTKTHEGMIRFNLMITSFEVFI